MQGREEAKHGCGQGMDAETAIAGPRVGLLRLLTKAAAVGAVPAAAHATPTSPPRTGDATFLEQERRWVEGIGEGGHRNHRWPPPSVSGDHVTRPAARVRHQTRMRCPTKRVVRTRLSKRCRRRGVATVWVDSCWVRSDHITIPSIHHSPRLVGPTPSGGDRSRRHRLPGRFPVRHGLVVPDVLRCHAARSGRAASVMLGRSDGRARVSQGSLTIASNSACSHSSSSQTNAQKSSSTAPEPSAAPVSSRPSMPLTPSRSSKKPADVCPLV